MKHHETVLFAVGLMSDPTPLVDHVYQILINDELEEISNNKHYSSLTYDLASSDVLKSLYGESQAQLSGHPLHNKYINYYSPYRRPRYTTVYIPSKVYEFRNVGYDIVLGTEHREQEAETPECALIIYHPDKAVTQSLLSNCQVIMRNQPVNNLYMKDFKSADIPQTFVFNISKHIQSLTLRWCDFQSQTLNHLLEQINECSTLRIIDLGFTNLKDLSSLTISNKTPLTHLDLGWAHMSQELSQNVCHQLSDLTELRYLDLSGNDLSYIDTICLSNKPNLSYLNCRNTQMSIELNKNLIGQLRYITQLSELDLSYNTLTGCISCFVPDDHPGLPELKNLILMSTALNKGDLHHLLNIIFSNKLPNLEKMYVSYNTLTGCISCFVPDPHPGLPELESLSLNDTALNNDDLHHLTHLIQTHKLPGLEHLNLNDNRLCEMETDVEHLIEACVTHHQRRLWLRMWDNDLSDAFREKWEQRCAGTNIDLTGNLSQIVL